MSTSTVPSSTTIDFAAAFPSSRKVYVERNGVRVPMRKIRLSGGEPPLRVYDTSGPQGHDPREGLPPLRRPWILARGDLREVEPAHRPASSKIPPTLRRPVMRGSGAATQRLMRAKGS